MKSPIPRDRGRGVRAGRRAIAALALASSLGLTGCAVVTDPADLTPEVLVEEPAVTGAAQRAFGAVDVAAGYDFLTEFVLAYSFEDALLDPQRSQYTAADLTQDLLPFLSPPARDGYRALVEQALAGSADAQDAVRTLRFYDWDQSAWTVPEPEGPVARQAIVEVEIDIAAATAERPQSLVVTFVHTATLRYLENGEPFDLRIDKPMAFRLIPSDGSGGWWIDSYDGEFAVTAGE